MSKGRNQVASFVFDMVMTILTACSGSEAIKARIRDPNLIKTVRQFVEFSAIFYFVMYDFFFLFKEVFRARAQLSVSE